MASVALRPHQRYTAEAIRAAIRGGCRRPLAVRPARAGKTTVSGARAGRRGGRSDGGGPRHSQRGWGGHSDFDLEASPLKWGWARGAAVGIAAGGALLLCSGVAFAAATISAPDVNQVQAISSDAAVAWIQNLAALAFACGAAATAFFLVRLVLRMYGTDERGTPETMRQMLWFGAGFIVLAGAAFWLGVLKGLAPSA